MKIHELIQFAVRSIIPAHRMNFNHIHKKGEREIIQS